MERESFSSLSEKEIYNHDPFLHGAIVDLIDKIPVERRPETLEQMKQEPLNKWRLILDELTALSRDTEEGEEDRELMEVINSGRPNSIIEYVHSKRNIAERFLLTYPTLTFLMSRISPPSTIFPLLFEMGRSDLVPYPIINSNNIRNLIKNGYKEHIKEAIREGADIDVIFCLAIESNSYLIVKMIIDEYKYNFSLTALLRVIIRGRKDLIPLMAFKLLEKDALLIHYKVIMRFITHIKLPGYITRHDRIQKDNAKCFIDPQKCLRDIIKKLFLILPYAVKINYVYRLLDFLIEYEILLPYFENERDLGNFLIRNADEYVDNDFMDDIIDFLIYHKKIEPYLTEYDLERAR